MSLHNNNVGILGWISGNADGARIHGNDITGNLRIGIGLFGNAEGAKITSNDLSDTGGFIATDGSERGRGYVGSADGVSLIGNVINDSARQGILLIDDLGNFAERNTIRDNTVLDSGRVFGGGIVLWGSDETDRPRDNMVQSNTVFSSVSDISDLGEGFGPAGPQLVCLNTWKDNDFDTANPADCIE